MATNKKKTTKKVTPVEEITEEITSAPVEVEEVKETPVEEVKEETPVEEVKEAPVKVEKTKEKPKKEKLVKKETPKYAIGSIVYVSKDADADLNGFKLFPQYKKYTYTVEAYDEISDVYSLRRLNLSLRLPEALIISPDERAHDMINRRQF